ncbi:hypothetical protein [Massilia sp. Mn16-1_5]|uniref:hypothetical protein n=1 Tax=Massilia sp. Mn16-1_5 TaxID=2079199 RepID=UPI00109EBCB8|nr:hypothetical protein [Massilia sp. Mn16-1_5]THC46194.1 hypothetical protein C2862_02930 [Massilia sp. Mn16-1_5]
MKVMRSLPIALAAALALLMSGCATEYYHTPHEMADVYGTYPLSDGDTLRIEKMGNRAFARLNGAEPVRLTSVGPLEFVTQDQSLHLQFEPLPFTTEVTVERLRY